MLGAKARTPRIVERVWGSNPIVRNILTLVGNNTSAIYVYVCEPLPDGQDRIDILLDNLRSSSADPSSLTFEDIIVSWFPDLLLGSITAISIVLINTMH